MNAPPSQSNPPWAFWSPSSDAYIEQALRLAKVGPGTRFLDLGCGDGRVLVAAARLGASVRGIEIDPTVADIARTNLAAAEVPGSIDIADIYTAPLDAEVIYAYLTPVTLSRLRGRFTGLPTGTRIVTPRYPVAGWEPTAADAQCYLYETPARLQSIPAAPGWPWRATVLALPAGRRVLVPIAFNPRCGPFDLELDPQLCRAANYAVGGTDADSRSTVPVDLIFHSHEAGSAIAGSIRAQGMDATVAVVFTLGLLGQWNFGAHQGDQFRETLDSVIAASREGH